MNEEVLEDESCEGSAFVFMLDLGESALAVHISAHCGTWLSDLVWKPLSPPKGSLGIRKKGPRKGSSFGKSQNLIVLY